MYALTSHLVILILLTPSWFYAGRLAARFKLPIITGYILAGVFSGPESLGIVTPKMLAALDFLDHLCLSVIALAAGAELQVAELRKIKRQVTTITLGISVFTWVLVFTCAMGLAPYIPFTAEAPPHAVGAITSLVATLAVARSPASAIAVLKETEGKGPYCSLVMAVVVLKDVLVFVLFSLNIELAKTASKSGQAISAEHLLEPLGRILLSMVLGMVGGVALAGVHTSYNPLSGIISRELSNRLRPLGPLAVSGGTFFVTEFLGGEPLLSCVTAGLVVANTKIGSGTSGGPDTMDALASNVGKLMPLVNLGFFGLVGASLKLAAMMDTLWAAAVLFLVRLMGIWLGCYSGASLGGTPDGIGDKVWMGMVTQAGVALGLAQIVAGAFEWGPDFSALITGVVLMNLFSGPPLFKAAVIAAGEARAMALPVLATEFDSGLKRDASMQQLPQIPQIPIISAESLVAAGSSLKSLMSGGSLWDQEERQGGSGQLGAKASHELEQRLRASQLVGLEERQRVGHAGSGPIELGEQRQRLGHLGSGSMELREQRQRSGLGGSGPMDLAEQRQRSGHLGSGPIDLGEQRQRSIQLALASRELEQRLKASLMAGLEQRQRPGHAGSGGSSGPLEVGEQPQRSGQLAASSSRELEQRMRAG